MNKNKKENVVESPAEEVVVESPISVVEEEVVEEVAVEEVTVDGEEVADGMVEIVSADNRILEASIGEKVWKGTTIVVPAEQEEDVRRLLENGGFFIK